MSSNDPTAILNEKKTNFANYLDGLNKKLNNTDLAKKIELIRSVDLGTFLVGMTNSVLPLLDRDPIEICREYNIDSSALESPDIDKIIRYCKLFTGKT